MVHVLSRPPVTDKWNAAPKEYSSIWKCRFQCKGMYNMHVDAICTM